MPYVTVGKENGANIDIYYKDWGSGQPIVFSHGWPTLGGSFEPADAFLPRAKVTASLRRIGADMVARLKPRVDTTWTTMPTI